MFVLQVQRTPGNVWVTIQRGTLETCRMMLHEWIALGYTGETKITAGR
jgi:hypothetical protein